MEFSLHSATHGPIEVKPIPLDGVNPGNEQLGLALGSFGQLVFQEIAAGPYRLFYNTWNIKEKFLPELRDSGPVLQLLVALKGPFINWVKGVGEFYLLQGQYNILYTPELHAAVYFGEPEEFLTFHLHFPMDLLYHYLGIFPTLQEFIDQIKAEKPTLLFPEAGWTTSEMLRGINNLADLPRGKDFSAYFLDLKVKDLFFNLLVQKYHRGKGTISNKNLEGVRNARHFIEAHLGKMLNVSTIAKLSGMKVHTLKKYFKQVVGIGLADFILKARMNNALFLLREQPDMPIKRIAWMNGYDHEENFLQAFKKHFGITPKNIRSNEMRWP